MLPARLEQIGLALYGTLWQSALARSLGFSDRQVRRWASGDTRIPDRINGKLEALIREKILILAALL